MVFKHNIIDFNITLIYIIHNILNTWMVNVASTVVTDVQERVKAHHMQQMFWCLVVV